MAWIGTRIDFWVKTEVSTSDPSRWLHKSRSRKVTLELTPPRIPLPPPPLLSAHGLEFGETRALSYDLHSQA